MGDGLYAKYYIGYANRRGSYEPRRFQPVKEVSPSCKLFGIMEKKRTGGKKNGTVATG